MLGFQDFRETLTKVLVGLQDFLEIKKKVFLGLQEFREMKMEPFFFISEMLKSIIKFLFDFCYNLLIRFEISFDKLLFGFGN